MISVIYAGTKVVYSAVYIRFIRINIGRQTGINEQKA